MSAASPVVEAWGGQASSWPSTNSSPGGVPAASAQPASAPMRIGQSPPTTRSRWPSRTAAGDLGADPTQGRGEVGGVDDAVRAAGAATADRPGRRRGRRAGQLVGVDATRPASRRARGARATPSVVPEEFVGTPRSAIVMSRRAAPRTSRVEAVDVAAVLTEGVDERRGDDHAVRAGLRDRPHVGRLAHAEPDADRDRRRRRDVAGRGGRPSSAAPSGRRSPRPARRSTGTRRFGRRSRRAVPAGSWARRGRRRPGRLRARRPRTARPRPASGRRR